MFYGIIHDPGCRKGWLEYNPPHDKTLILCPFCQKSEGGFHVIELDAEYFTFRDQGDTLKAVRG